jgi:hypothetical protein
MLVKVEATRWFRLGDHPAVRMEQRDRRPNGILGPSCSWCSTMSEQHGEIDTPEGSFRVCPGDWIVTGVAGEHHPVKPHVFDQICKPVYTKSVAPPGPPEPACEDRAPAPDQAYITPLPQYREPDGRVEPCPAGRHQYDLFIKRDRQSGFIMPVQACQACRALKPNEPACADLAASWQLLDRENGSLDRARRDVT